MDSPWVASVSEGGIPAALAAGEGNRPDYSLQLSLGNAWNHSESVTVTQDGAQDISFTADYETRGFEEPFYYALRFGRWKHQRAWEFELVHHKLYVEDTPPDIQKFELTDGFNLVMVNHAWQTRHFNWRLGAGTVVAHPDITVRGQSNYESGGGAVPRFWEDGYHWGGYALQAAIEKRFDLGRHLFLSVEAKGIYADADVPVANGEVGVRNRSVHMLFGIGGRF